MLVRTGPYSVENPENGSRCCINGELGSAIDWSVILRDEDIVSICFANGSLWHAPELYDWSQG